MIWSLVLTFLGANPPHVQPTWTAKVGEYGLVKWVNGDRQTMYLKDAGGRVVTVLSDFHVGLLADLWSEKPVRTYDVNADQVPEIIFETSSGGAHGSNSYFIWSLGRQPRCLLAYDKNNISGAGDFEVVDLDGDGIQEIRSWYDGFAYTVGGSYWKDLPIVLKLEGGRYIDRTSNFRKMLLSAERSQWEDLMLGDRKVDPNSWTSPSAPAVNLIALAELLGHPSKTWRRLEKVLPAGNLAWLRQRSRAILRIIRRRSERYAYPPAYKASPFTFTPPLDQQNWPSK